MDIGGSGSAREHTYETRYGSETGTAATGGVMGDWRQVDRALRSIASRRAALDAEEARWLREAERLMIWQRLGFVSALDYMERALGYGPRAARTGAVANAGLVPPRAWARPLVVTLNPEIHRADRAASLSRDNYLDAPRSQVLRPRGRAHPRGRLAAEQDGDRGRRGTAIVTHPPRAHERARP